ncbi:MAG: hypothetical protein U0869_01080 [Chloroflexota bacterium]
MLDGTGLGVETIALAEDPVLRRHLDALVVRTNYTGVGLAQFLVPPVGEPTSWSSIRATARACPSRSAAASTYSEASINWPAPVPRTGCRRSACPMRTWDAVDSASTG